MFSREKLFILLAAIIIIAVAAFAVSRVLSNSNTSPTAAPAPTQPTAVVPPAATPATPAITPGQIIKISANDLYHEFEKDAPTANAKYRGKTLEINGRVFGIYSDELRTFITEGEGFTWGITCYFNNKKDLPVGLGARVVVRGTYKDGDYIFQGRHLDVSLSNCILTK